MEKLKKILRYIRNYGLDKTLFKVGDRKREKIYSPRRRSASPPAGKGVCVPRFRLSRMWMARVDYIQ